MKTILIFALMLTFPTTSVLAAGPFVDWGQDLTEWDYKTGSFNSGPCIYDPNHLGGGLSWQTGSGYLVYTPIFLHLYIEMSMIQTYRYTTYQWHRLGNHEEDVCFIIQGTIQSNNGQYISLMHQDPDPMTHLLWQGNIFGSGSASDIPIAWDTRWGNGLVYGEQIQQGWTGQTPNPDLTMLIEDPCDHWYEFRGCFHLDYHQVDGEWCLELAGCPAPLL